MKVTVNESVCIGAGNCVQLSPQVFDQRVEDGTVVLRILDPAPELFDSIRRAAKNCPSGAITASES